MAKKKHHKKQQFKYGQASQHEVAQTGALTAEKNPPKLAANAKATTNSGDFGYVRTDLMKVALLAAVFVSAELVLWLAFNHTGLGASVYRLIKV